ncbi:MAG: Selenoprotein O and cysteine-containing homologs [uncultured Sphingomonadaceae bacterium]|uniref:Protein nucleotidyltransferase YdiU n=1 Tax=uncultured Sphingomonadaceae bacterium TaxID=169976 RepID=A0A6J4TAT4_9SPHN|nr:MAG: Selenoprotein O and cysteine-containing homologs [uncultured Sphingomonadaceae bacterium]
MLNEPRPETAILSLDEAFYDPVEPARFPQHVLRFRNDRAAAEVGLAGLSDEHWTARFAAFEPLPGSLAKPLALRYHGHQFGSYNPEIGDGRGFLYAQLRDARGRLMDLGTKGSGRTPYSRFGDGKLTLKGGVREILATEMLEALDVPTSRSFSLVETGEALTRGDEPSPTRSAVLVRLSHGHIRIGTFQRLAYFGDEANMRRLVDYCLRELHEVEPEEHAPAQLLRLVADGCARLVASYMAAGFVHGVLNTDNIAITAESFDYGPWRFTPKWDPEFTAAYFDHAGRYAFARQPGAIHWNLAQLAMSLSLLAPVEELAPALEAFPVRFQAELAASLLRRLGVAPGSPEDDLAVANKLDEVLLESGAEIDRFFFDWRGGAPRRDAGAYAHPCFAKLRDALVGRAAAPGALDHAYWADDAPCSMHIEEVEALWAAIDERDDWGPLHAKVAGMRRMGEALGAAA